MILLFLSILKERGTPFGTVQSLFVRSNMLTLLLGALIPSWHLFDTIHLYRLRGRRRAAVKPFPIQPTPAITDPLLIVSELSDMFPKIPPKVPLPCIMTPPLTPPSPKPDTSLPPAPGSLLLRGS